MLGEISTTVPATGGDDDILVGDGDDVVFGGIGVDYISIDRSTGDPLGVDSGDDVFVGDNGFALFDTKTGASLLIEIRTSDPDEGDDDFIFASDGSDVVLGGSGNDFIDAGTDTSRDIVVGDNGFALFDLVDIGAGLQSVLSEISTTVPATGGTDDILVGDGDDVVFGGIGIDYISIERSTGAPLGVDSGDDVFVGDNGFAKFDTTTGASLLTVINTSDPDQGDNDFIFASDGSDVVLGGSGSDFIDAGTDASRDIVVGDNGFAKFDTTTGASLLSEIRTSDSEQGDDDFILASDGSDVVLGGSGSDFIDAGTDTSRDIVVGDNGFALFDLVNIEGELQSVLGEIGTTVPATGGDDDILVGDGDDVVFGGIGIDYISIERSSGAPLGADSGDDVFVGDNGFAKFDTTTGASLLTEIRTSDPDQGANDFIFASDGSDVVLGGSGSDFIDAGTDTSRDIVVGDNGFALFDLVDIDAGLQSVLGEIGTTVPVTGGTDDILVGDGDDVVFGGIGIDYISIERSSGAPLGVDSGDDVFVGDNGFAKFDTTTGASLLTEIRTSDPDQGANDFIFASDGSDVVLGGSGNDFIDAGTDTSRDIVVGDNGFALFDLVDIGAGLQSVLSEISTTVPATGGDDDILVGNGDDVVLGGIGVDYISIDRATELPVGVDSGDDVFVGDNGSALFDTTTGASLLIEIRTSDPDEGDDDVIFASDGDDVVLGGAGSDLILAGEGHNIVLGDEGRITYQTGTGLRDRITSRDLNEAGFAPLDADDAQVGNDTISTGTGNDVVIGGLGTDTITVADGNNIVLGDEGFVQYQNQIDTDNTSVLGEVSSFYLDLAGAFVQGGNDTITVGASAGSDGLGSDIVIGGLGADGITIGSGNNIVLGDEGSVTFQVQSGLRERIESRYLDNFGDSPTNALDADVGNDTVSTGIGNDIVIGGLGIDGISIDDGDNIVLADEGLVVFEPGTGAIASIQTLESAEGGNDNVTTGDGADVILGGFGEDNLTGGGGTAVVLGDNGLIEYTLDGDSSDIDRIVTVDPSEGGDDVITSGSGADILIGGTGSDTIHAGGGSDVVLGDFAEITGDIRFHQAFPPPNDPNFVYTSIDINHPGAGDDTIHAGSGDDFILGQQGRDTIFGEDGEDDITGGHNVLFGSDDDDTIDGGPEPDVILGDNGVITRHLLPGNVWERYPEPFAHVIRDIVRFDDIDLVQGDDLIFGGDGEDIIHGQRGDDEIHGGAGDDELMGELGSDELFGDAGHDFIAGDVGLFVRAFETDGSIRLNASGAWHRDLVTEEVGVLTRLLDISRSPNGALAADVRDLLLNADLLLLMGVYDADGNRVADGHADSWQTRLGLIDLLEGDDDRLDGGGGEDFLIGQRGDDVLSGGDDGDLLIGDMGWNRVSFENDLPFIIAGLRILDAQTGSGIEIQIADGGNVIFLDRLIQPRELEEFMARWMETTPAVESLVDAFSSDANRLVLSDGNFLRPGLAFVPVVGPNADGLSGNDELTGGGGDDLVIGDNLTVVSQNIPDFSRVQRAIDDVSEGILGLEVAFEHLRMDAELLDWVRNGGEAGEEIVVSADRISGDDGEDILIGDNAVLAAPIVDHGEFDESTYQSYVLEFYGRVRDLEWLLGDAQVFVEHTYSRLLHDLVGEASADNPSGKKPKKSDLINVELTPIAARRDEIEGGDGADLIIGDDALLAMPVTSRVDTRREAEGRFGTAKKTDKDLEKALKDEEKDRDKSLKRHEEEDHEDPLDAAPGKKELDLLPWRLGVLVRKGNDHLDGGAGEDWIIGDLGVVIWPSELDVPTKKKDVRDLEKEVDRLAKDLGELVIDLGRVKPHSNLNSQHHYHHGHGGSAGGSDGDVDTGSDSDVIIGGSGNDLIFGDDALVRPEFEQNVGVEAYSGHATDYFRFGSAGNSDGGTDGGDDEIHGNEGDDILLGQGGDDVIFGEEGEDLLVGGKGRDDLDGGPDKDKIMPAHDRGHGHGSDGDPDRMRTLSNPWIDAFTKDLAGFRSQILPDQSLWMDFGSDGGSDGRRDGGSDGGRG